MTNLKLYKQYKTDNFVGSNSNGNECSLMDKSIFKCCVYRQIRSYFQRTIIRLYSTIGVDSIEYETWLKIRRIQGYDED